ncbi:MAG: membrane protease subunit [Gemmatimonadaceae bacterium]
MSQRTEVAFLGCGGLGVLGAIVAAFAIGCPQYAVYEQRKTGEAELARATSNRTISVTEAHAKFEAAIELAKADTVRAHGIAESNAIIGQSLKGNPEYLTWLYLDNLKDTKDQIIYIPTEASLPILEAGRLAHLGKASPDTTRKP